ncbi:hypothetical protein [Priestia filamentosa]|uniref:hypothetical protein n=1 Tax=Priestia filamentosa TaxID=1402861 RepID=UPI00398252EA
MDYFLFAHLHFSPYTEAFIKVNVQHSFEHQLTGFYQQAFDTRLEKAKQWMGMRMEVEKRRMDDDSI